MNPTGKTRLISITRTRIETNFALLIVTTPSDDKL
jgi:hypothetical protein